MLKKGTRVKALHSGGYGGLKGGDFGTVVTVDHNGNPDVVFDNYVWECDDTEYNHRGFFPLFMGDDEVEEINE